MKKILTFAFVAMMLFGVSTTFIAPSAVAAGPSPECENQNRFLLFKPWFSGLVDGKCNIVSPTKVDTSSDSGNSVEKTTQKSLQAFIWTIALNLIEDLLIATGYACIGFIMYGGFKYMTSTGSPDGMTKAKQIIMNAVIGLVISLVAVGVVNLITSIFIS